MLIRKTQQPSSYPTNSIHDSYNTATTDTYSCHYINNNVSGDSIPIGTMMPYGNETPPNNWLVCDGSAVSRTTYADLFAVIGTSYGSGDGSTTFNLPDKKGKVSVGLDPADSDFNTIGNHTGQKEVYLQVSQMPSHSHGQVVTANAGSGGSAIRRDYVEDASGLTTYAQGCDTYPTGGGQPHTNVQPSEVDQWIIKALKDTNAPSSSQVQNVRTVSSTDVYSCTYVNGIGNNILWENANPTSTFASQTITLTNSNYNNLIVFYKELATNNYVQSEILRKGYGGRLYSVFTPSDVKIAAYSREMQRTDDTTFVFTDASYTYMTTAERGTNNNLMVPILIIGL